MLATRPPTSGGSDEVEWDQKEMPFTEHLRELRQRLIICVGHRPRDRDPRAVAGPTADPDHHAHLLPRDHSSTRSGRPTRCGRSSSSRSTSRSSSACRSCSTRPGCSSSRRSIPRTRKAVYLYVAPSIFLAAAGIAFAHYLVIPRVIGALLAITSTIADAGLRDRVDDQSRPAALPRVRADLSDAGRHGALRRASA